MTTVLVIDDSPSEMAKFREILVKNNFTMLEASNGERGIELAIEEVPDVILMDVVMPEMNGFQATRKISRNKTTAHIPIVIVSTKNQETDRVWGKRQGAKDYLTKPFSEGELLSAIKNVQPTRNATATQAMPKKPVQATPSSSPSTQNTKSSHTRSSSTQTSRTQSSTTATPTMPPVTETKANQQKPSNGIYL